MTVTVSYKYVKGLTKNYVRWIIKPATGKRITGSAKSQGQAEKRVKRILEQLNTKP